MKISVCIDALFNGQDLETSMTRVKNCGIDTIEFWEWGNKDLDRMETLLAKLDMEVATFCNKSTSLVDPKQHHSYLQGLSESLEAAKRLGVKKLIGLVGNDTGLPRMEQQGYLIEGLKKCVPLLEAADVVLMIEPLNSLVDHKGYYLNRSEEAFELVEAINSKHIKVLFDIYHQQITEGNLIRNIQANIGQISHIHTAGNPGRNELYLGEINYYEIFKRLNHMCYDGYIGLEYFPIEAPEVGLRKTLDMIIPIRRRFKS